MPPRRLNPNLVKLNRSYDVGELAEVFDLRNNAVAWDFKPHGVRGAVAGPTDRQP